MRKTARVNAPIARAFDVFTSGLSRWWPHDHSVGKKPVQKVLIEPRLGGRWLEISQDGTETIVATTILWEPPNRVVMVWQVNAQRGWPGASSSAMRKKPNAAASPVRAAESGNNNPE